MGAEENRRPCSLLQYSGEILSWRGDIILFEGSTSIALSSKNGKEQRVRNPFITGINESNTRTRAERYSLTMLSLS